MYTIMNCPRKSCAGFLCTLVSSSHISALLQRSFTGVSLKPSLDQASTAVDWLVIAVELDLHGPVLELNAVETLDRSLGLLAGLELHGAPALGAAGVGVADGFRLDHGANLLEHLPEVLAGGGPREVANDNLETRGRLGATRVGTAGLVRAARALEAHDDGAALEVGVVEGGNGVVRRVGGLKVDETPALGPAAGLPGNLGLDHGANLGAVGDEGLLVGLPREVADVAAGAVGGGGVADGGSPVAAALGGGGLGGRLVLADGDVAIAEGVTVEGLDGDLSLVHVGVLDDAVAAGAALAAGGNVHEGDGTAAGEDAAELIDGGGPGDVADVEAVGGTLSHGARKTYTRFVRPATAPM
mmetsp:Transcript_6914/g.30267  ORF Transcript_6914/g.30267 Transcript_6914/m.30267 type:complete len:356 (+) Transcript_6914:246-1313(+)